MRRERISPPEAVLLLQRIVDLPWPIFWDDDVAMATSKEVEPSRLQGHRQVTDAHLVALAIRRDGFLATFDGGVRQLVPKNRASEEAVRVIPADLGGR